MIPLNLSDDQQLFELLSKFPTRPMVLNFRASWVEQCQAVTSAIDELAIRFPSLVYAHVEAEECADASERFKILSVPSVVIVVDGMVKEMIVGAKVTELVKAVERTFNRHSLDLDLTGQADLTASLTPTNAMPTSMNEHLEALINLQPLTVFIKGTPSQPQCGFTSTLLQILALHKLPFASFDILADPRVRQSLKEYSNWPTYPQIYWKGELIGGLDIFKEMAETEGGLDDIKVSLGIL